MSQFHFKNFEPDFKLRFQAHLVLSRILDTTPYGASGVGLIEKKGDTEYHCLLDIYSPKGPFMANAVGTTPDQAMTALEAKVRNQLQEWKTQRREALQQRLPPSDDPVLAVS